MATKREGERGIHTEIEMDRPVFEWVSVLHHGLSPVEGRDQLVCTWPQRNWSLPHTGRVRFCGQDSVSIVLLLARDIAVAFVANARPVLLCWGAGGHILAWGPFQSVSGAAAGKSRLALCLHGPHTDLPESASGDEIFPSHGRRVGR